MDISMYNILYIYTLAPKSPIVRGVLTKALIQKDISSTITDTRRCYILISCNCKAQKTLWEIHCIYLKLVN